MFCPNPDCPHRKETGHPAAYRDGISTCADCGAALTAEPIGDLAEDIEALDLEPLTAITEPAFGALVRAVLDEAGIRYSMRGEGVQDLFTVGRIGTGYNLITGPGTLFVERARAAEARELLAALEEGGGLLEADELAGSDEP
jgi:hypothetical protein